MRILPLSVFCITFPLAVMAQPYKAINTLSVAPLPNGDFEVIEANGEGARGIWCAAADYVLSRSGNSARGRLYVKTPRGPSVSGAGRIGVVFTTDVERLGVAPQKSYSVSTRIKGLGLPIQHAVAFCRDYQLEPDNIFYYLQRN